MFGLEPYIPYKGNKFGIIDNIYSTIRTLDIEPFKVIKEPFCGGGSFSYFMASRGYKVEASDIDSSVIALHNTCRERPELIEEFGKCGFTKEQFKAMLNDETAFGAYVRSVWSFSNDGRTYLTSSENEQNKLEQFARGEAEPNSRHKHIEDISLLWTRKKLALTFECKSYETVTINEGELGYCFTPEHEILTKRGWVKVSEINDNDEMLSREPETGKLEYVKNTKKIEINYSGELYEYDSKSVSLAVSMEHNLFVSKRFSKSRKDSFIKARDASNKKFDFIFAGGNWGKVFEPFYLNGREVDKRKFARLLGLFITDGSCNNQGRVFFCQKKKNIVKILKDLLEDLKIKYSEYSNGTFYIHSCDDTYFKSFAVKSERRIPEEFRNSDRETLIQLLNGILDGDSDSERRKIYIGSESLMNDIMEIAFKAGLAAKAKKVPPKKSFLKSENRWIIGKKPYYVISILNKPYKNCIHSHEKRTMYNGKLYCCTLEKWHTVLVRRNGKCVWCGQCDPPYASTAGYRSGGFDHDKFYEWALAQKGLVLISEYEMPDSFYLVARYQKWVESGRGARTKMGEERLYANKPVKVISLF